MEAVKKEDEKETTKDKNGIATILAIILIEKNIFVDFLEVIVYTFQVWEEPVIFKTDNLYQEGVSFRNKKKINYRNKIKEKDLENHIEAGEKNT